MAPSASASAPASMHEYNSAASGSYGSGMSGHSSSMYHAKPAPSAMPYGQQWSESSAAGYASSSSAPGSQATSVQYVTPMPQGHGVAATGAYLPSRAAEHGSAQPTAYGQPMAYTGAASSARMPSFIAVFAAFAGLAVLMVL
jgi:hypothetical protein